jgi:hypothetical protein
LGQHGILAKSQADLAQPRCRERQLRTLGGAVTPKHAAKPKSSWRVSAAAERDPQSVACRSSRP